jgi:hypothetical protein
MIDSAPNRRHILATGVAGALCTLTGFGPFSAALAAPVFPHPFVGSRTVSRFADSLFFYEDVMPVALRRMIEAELARTDIAPDSPVEERLRAQFFAWLAVREIAPRALRRAGYDRMAVEVANGKLHPAGAQHAIGKQYAYSPTPPLAGDAYGACAHASTARFFADHEDIEVVIESGHYCARALVSTLPEEDDEAKHSWIWDFAVRTINTARDVSSDADAQHGLNLQTPA